MRKFFPFATSIVLVGSLFSFSVGCSKRPNDETITKDIQGKVAADADVKDSNVSVASKDGQSYADRHGEHRGRAAEIGTDRAAGT